jgi:hypothetical protein
MRNCAWNSVSLSVLWPKNILHFPSVHLRHWTAENKILSFFLRSVYCHPDECSPCCVWGWCDQWHSFASPSLAVRGEVGAIMTGFGQFGLTQVSWLKNIPIIFWKLYRLKISSLYSENYTDIWFQHKVDIRIAVIHNFCGFLFCWYLKIFSWVWVFFEGTHRHNKGDVVHQRSAVMS